MGKSVMQSSQEASQTPRELPQVSPQSPNVGWDHSFLMQAILENQKTLGRLEEGMSGVKDNINGMSQFKVVDFS